LDFQTDMFGLLTQGQTIYYARSNYLNLKSASALLITSELLFIQMTQVKFYVGNSLKIETSYQNNSTYFRRILKHYYLILQLLHII